MRKHRFENISFFLFSALLFAYLALRAFYAGTINDEAFSFFTYVHSGNFLPLVSTTHLSANNHMINSLLSWLSYRVFGVSEWAIRLPNLLAFPLYMWYLYKLGRHLSQSYLRWLFWLLLSGAHYYLEFFAYSRGYGLGFAFLAGSVFHLIEAGKPGTSGSKHVSLGLALIFLGTLSNLNLLVSFLIWVALALQILWFGRIDKKPFFYLLCISSVLAVLFAAWSLQLNSSEQLVFGLASLSGSFTSLVTVFTGFTASFAFWAYLPVLLFVLIMGAYWLIKKPFFKISALNAFYIFFVLNILGSLFMHYLLGVNYALERTGFHWYFFMAGALIFSIDQFGRYLKPLLAAIAFVILLPVLAFTAKSLSFYSSVNEEWKRQQISDEFFFKTRDLNSESDFPLSMYAPENFYTVNMAFKNLKYHDSLNVCNSFPQRQPMYFADLLIIDTVRYPESMNLYEEVFYDEHSTMSLLKRKVPLTKILLSDTTVQSIHSSKEAFTLLADFLVPDTLKGDAFRVNYDLHLSSPEKPLLSLITLEVRDTSGQMIFYEQVSLDYFETDFSNGFKQELSIVFDQAAARAHSIRCILWNFEEKAFTLNSSHVDLYQLIEN